MLFAIDVAVARARVVEAGIFSRNGRGRGWDGRCACRADPSMMVVVAVVVVVVVDAVVVVAVAVVVAAFIALSKC